MAQLGIEMNSIFLQEKLIFNMYLHHFGEDLLLIEEKMNQTFKRTFRPAMLRDALEQIAPQTDSSEFTVQEFEKIAYLYTLHVRKQSVHIWRNVQPFMNYRLTKVICSQFYFEISTIIRVFIQWYAKPSKWKVYNHRICRLTQCTINMLFYIGTSKITILWKDDQALSAIWKACDLFYRLFRYLVKQRLFYISGVQQFFQNMDRFPDLTEEQIQNIIEPLLLLDTIIRVCLRCKPYRDSQNTEEYDKKLKEQQLQHQDIPPLMKRQPRAIELDQQQLGYTDCYFFRLTIDQQLLLQKSSTAVQLIPLIVKMQQTIGNKKDMSSN